MSAKEIQVYENKAETSVASDVALTNIITHAIQIPGVKVDRKKFLAATFSKETDKLETILDVGPIVAGIEEKKLKNTAEKLILDRTTKSSLASFAMGIPGGLTMAATIPVDIMQFYGMTLKLAQELTYLYGAQDLWQDGEVNEELVKNQLILYCGVMFGVAGASAGVRLLSTQLAKTAFKKLPQKALTKTFWYPIIKQIGKGVGIKVTKKALAKGVEKVIPVIGGVVAGAMTFASMKPMASRLLHTLEEVNFHYTEEEFNRDIEIIEAIDENAEIKLEENVIENKQPFLGRGKEKIGNLFKKKSTDKVNDDNF